MYAGMLNAFRVRTLGLAPQRRFADMLVRASGAPVPVLYPYSPQLLPVPADYPAHVHVTGTWFLDRPADWQPPVALQEFLEAGPPPVYVGFGSGGRGGVKRAQVVLEALALAGQRGVLARGWGGLQATDLPDTVYMLDAAPHDWLFPQPFGGGASRWRRHDRRRAACWQANRDLPVYGRSAVLGQAGAGAGFRAAADPAAPPDRATAGGGDPGCRE